MYLIVGLGNIGSEYNKTRHNIGFDSIDVISKEYNTNVDKVKFKGCYGETRIENHKVIFLKPSTYVNLSGDSVKQAVDYYDIDSEHLIVIHDDISLDTGKVRLRAKGSAGGHNGIKDIIKKLGTNEFFRIKIGVGKPERDCIEHVLGRISEEEREYVDRVLEECPNIVRKIIKEGMYEAMNSYNGIDYNNNER